ncbi:hypothetical protein TKK_0017886 [Trichogramma kaykai]
MGASRGTITLKHPEYLHLRVTPQPKKNALEARVVVTRTTCRPHGDFVHLSHCDRQSAGNLSTGAANFSLS